MKSRQGGPDVTALITMRYRTKLTLTLLAVAMFSGGLLLWLSHRSASAAAFELMQEKVLAIATSGAPLIDGDTHERITAEAHDGNEDYNRIRDALRSIRDANQFGDLKVRFVYTYRPVDAEGKDWVYVVDAEEEGSDDRSSIGEPVELDEYDELFPKVDEPNVDIEFITDKYGDWLSAWAPIRNSAGEAVALLGVDLKKESVVGKQNTLLIQGFAALGLALAAALVASIFLSGMVIAPLRTFRNQVSTIRDGDLTTRIPIATNDEFGQLGEAINQMADGLKEREAFKEALVRFVSSGAADAVIEESEEGGTSPGARRVTVLVSGLKGFDAVSGSLPPDQVATFLGDWYSRMIDIILQHRGSIERSTGQIVTATFGAPMNDPDQERHAVEAALTMQQELNSLRKRWKVGKDTGLFLDAAIHTGHVTITSQDDLHVMDVESLGRIIGAVSFIRDSAQTSGIVISETTEDGLRNTIPLTYLRSVEVGETGEMISLHKVEMPSPS